MNNINDKQTSFILTIFKLTYGNETEVTYEDVVARVASWKKKIEAIENIILDEEREILDYSETKEALYEEAHSTLTKEDKLIIEGFKALGKEWEDEDKAGWVEEEPEGWRDTSAFTSDNSIDVSNFVPNWCSPYKGYNYQHISVTKSPSVDAPAIVSKFLTDIQNIINFYSKSSFRYIKVKTRLKGKMIGRGEDKKRVNDHYVEYTFDTWFDYKQSLTDAVSTAAVAYDAHQRSFTKEGYLVENPFPTSRNGIEISVDDWSKAYHEQILSWTNSFNDYEPEDVFSESEDGKLFLKAQVVTRELLIWAEHSHKPKERKFRSGVTAAKDYLRNNFHNHSVRTIDLSSIDQITFIKAGELEL